MVHTWPTPRCEGAPGHLGALSPYGLRAVVRVGGLPPTWWALVHPATCNILISHEFQSTQNSGSRAGRGARGRHVLVGDEKGPASEAR